eukprot:765828-Hanusia_phi.AAC.3
MIVHDLSCRQPPYPCKESIKSKNITDGLDARATANKLAAYKRRERGVRVLYDMLYRYEDYINKAACHRNRHGCKIRPELGAFNISWLVFMVEFRM